MAEKIPATPAYDPWQDMREVYIPHQRGEAPTLEVGVNDRTFFVPKGEHVQVPMPLWEVIKGMLDAQKRMDEEAKNDPMAITPESARYL